MQKSIVLKTCLLSCIIFMQSCIEAKPLKRFSTNTTQILSQIDEIVAAGKIKYDALGLAVVLDKVNENAPSHPVNANFYKIIIEHFIKNGCDIYKKFQERLLYPFCFDFNELDPVGNNNQNECGSYNISQKEITVFHIALMEVGDKFLLQVLLEYGSNLTIQDQIDILSYPMEQMFACDSDFSVLIENMILFFKYCDKSAQEKFLELYPETKETFIQ